MDWERTQLLGEHLPELEILGFGPIEQAFWIKCEHCVHRHEIDADAWKICEDMEKECLEEKECRDAAFAAAELTMEGTTVEGSEVTTPAEKVAQQQPVSLALTREEPRKKRPRVATGTPDSEMVDRVVRKVKVEEMISQPLMPQIL